MSCLWGYVDTPTYKFAFFVSASKKCNIMDINGHKQVLPVCV